MRSVHLWNQMYFIRAAGAVSYLSAKAAAIAEQGIRRASDALLHALTTRLGGQTRRAAPVWTMYRAVGAPPRVAMVQAMGHLKTLRSLATRQRQHVAVVEAGW